MENRDNKLALLEGLPNETVWTTRRILEHLNPVTTDATLKATERAIQASPIRFEPLADGALVDEHGRSAKRLVLDQLVDTARKKRKLILFAQSLPIDNNVEFLVFNDARGGRRWIRLDEKKDSVNPLSAYQQKNFELADKFREDLEQHGVSLEDGPDGTTWKFQRIKTKK